MVHEVNQVPMVEEISVDLCTLSVLTSLVYVESCMEWAAEKNILFPSIELPSFRPLCSASSPPAKEGIPPPPFNRLLIEMITL